MRALVLTAIRELQILDVPTPKIVGPDDVLVRIRACGICGSDLHGYTGQSGRRRPPLIMGHEAAGEVVEVGPAVTAFHPGDHVTIQPWTYCGVCAACMDGKHLWCPHRSLMGMNIPGAFAEYLVCPAVNLFLIPASLPFEHASLTEAVAVALHAVTRASLKPYETAAIIGAGTIGLLVLAVVRLMGLRRLIAIDLDAHRLAVARDLGADMTVNPSIENVVEATQAVAGDTGVDHVFEAVGVSATFRSSIELARRGGEVIWIGNNEHYAEIDVQSIVTREISILPSYAFTLAEFARALELLAGQSIPARQLITRHASLEEGPCLFEELLQHPEIIKCVFRSTPC